MDACKSAIFAFQIIKLILQVITHLIQYMLLEIWFWSVKCTTGTVRYVNIWRNSIPSHQVQQAIAMVNMKTNQLKMLLNVFGTRYTYSLLIQIA